MDIYCPVCGEPWEIDSIHDVAEENGTSWDVERERFAMDGCAIFECSHAAIPDKRRAMAMTVLLEVMGDDLDGIAADLEDFETMGWLD